VFVPEAFLAQCNVTLQLIWPIREYEENYVMNMAPGLSSLTGIDLNEAKLLTGVKRPSLSLNNFQRP
jgi:hypothetical protein